MLAPKRSKFRKQQKGRTRGRAKGGDDQNGQKTDTGEAGPQLCNECHECLRNAVR